MGCLSFAIPIRQQQNNAKARTCFFIRVGIDGVKMDFGTNLQRYSETAKLQCINFEKKLEKQTIFCLSLFCLLTEHLRSARMSSRPCRRAQKVFRGLSFGNLCLMKGVICDYDGGSNRVASFPMEGDSWTLHFTKFYIFS